MKICKYCGQGRHENDFEIANTVGGKVYRRRKCKYCKTKTQKLRKDKLKKIVYEYKASHPCVKCGFDDPRALHFHHRDRDSKFKGVSRLMHGEHDEATLLAEMEKCDILCANCHSILHYDDK